METYSVFYLVGGSSNFVCRSVVGLHDWETACKHVEELKRSGYKATAIKAGHVIGGLLSYSDFDSDADRKVYYDSM